MERMTNPYFQDTEFASIMKAKHVIGGSDSDRDDVNNLLNQSNPIQQSDPTESLLSEQPDLNLIEPVILLSLYFLRGTRVIL